MTVIVPHNTTAEKAIAAIDASANRLFEGAAGSSVQLTDQKKSWNGRVMDFSLVARLGFVAVPLSGTIAVDDVNVTVQCEPPAIVARLLGDDKFRAGIEGKIRGMLPA